MTTGSKPVPIHERFFKHIKKTKTCWIWTANKYRCGYGQIGIGSRSNPPRKKLAAHRLSYEIYKGSIPKGLFVCHQCNVKICVNPEHLYLGTHQKNVRDAVKDGRFKRSKKWIDNRRGEGNSFAKFTESQIIEIRNIYKSKSMTQCELAKLFKTSQSHIYRIIHYKVWIHI